jgi:hypothetical protein
MEGIVRTLSENPLVASAVCFAALLIVYFLFKSLIKLAFILILVAVAVGGYYCLRYPESRPTNLTDAVEKVRTGAGKAVDQGKEMYEKGRELVDQGKEAYGKGKELVERGRVVLDKGIGKGKEVVEKGADAAGEIGKLLEEGKGAGDRQKP